MPTGSNSRKQRLGEASPVDVGDVVAGKYRVIEPIAVGGMGVVVLGEHEMLGHRVVLKFLLANDQGEEAILRFLREAKAAARIQSEHVVRVYDCGRLDDGVPYMVMEHLQGIELSKEMRARGALPPDEAVDIMLDALIGVAEAHAKGIVHRDLKPSNLFLAGRAGVDRVVKVLDFGISKIQPGPNAVVEDDDLTLTTMVLGSPRYISPEQARSSKTVDPRADIWSLGVVLYQMLTGDPPFGGDTFGEILTNILLSNPDPPVAKREDVPHELGDVVMRCLERDPERRYSSAAEFAAALAEHGGTQARAKAERIAAILGEPAASAPRSTSEPVADEQETRVTTQRGAGEESATQGTWSQASPATNGRRRGRYVALGALVMLALGGGLAYSLSQRSSAPDPTTAAKGGPPAERSVSSVEPLKAPEAEPSSSSPAVTATASSEPAASASAADDTPDRGDSPPSPPPPKAVPAPSPPTRPRPLVLPVPKPPPPPPPSTGVLDRSD